ncbi:hypothetical protein [Zobellella sp. An-6]|uniref:hypothetical protein n=1 Tax=Zobellella sp. An-6 TaxID=3400218 RepID=UPI00404319A2
MLELDYQAVKRKASDLLCWSARKRVFRTQPEQLVKLLSHYGIESFVTTFDDLDLSSTASLLGVNLESNGNFHWVVYIPCSSGCFIFDPETAAVYQSKLWLNKDDGYQIDKHSSRVASTSIKVREIRIQ